VDAQPDPAPEPPVEPHAADCCGEGCVHCIFDVHHAAVRRYAAELEQWRQRHPDA
jgi:hypothetical protein